MKTMQEKDDSKKTEAGVAVSKYAGKPLNSEKEASAKKHKKAANNLLQQLGLQK